LTADEAQAVATFERGYKTSSWWVEGEGPAEVQCPAVGMVTDFGIEKLEKYGVVDAHLEFDQASLERGTEPDAALFPRNPRRGCCCHGW